MEINNKAFTLIELILSIAIIGILAGTAIPSFNDFLERRKVSANLQSFVKAIQISRLTAITENKRVTVCPTSNGIQCGADWSAGLLSFVDEDEDRLYDAEDTLLFASKQSDQNFSVTWKAFGVKKSLQWLPTGITNHQNGSFELCYDGKPEHARALILTKAGRLRYSKDSDGDQIHEKSPGQPINC